MLVYRLSNRATAVGWVYPGGHTRARTTGTPGRGVPDVKPQG